MTDKITDAVAKFINSMSEPPFWVKEKDVKGRVGPLSDLQSRVEHLERQMAKLNDKEQVSAAMHTAMVRADQFSKKWELQGIALERVAMYFIDAFWDKEKKQ